MPLKSAIIWGMSVMATLRPKTRAMPPPTTMAITISSSWRGGARRRWPRGQHHADAGPEDAAAGGLGRAHAPQTQDEEQGGDEVARLDQGVSHEACLLVVFGSSFPLLNILSMRSVTA